MLRDTDARIEKQEFVLLSLRARETRESWRDVRQALRWPAGNSGLLVQLATKRVSQ